MSTPTLERGIDQNENEKKRDRTKGSRDLSPRYRKGRSKCVEERTGGGIVEHRRSDGTPPRSIYFRFTKREPRVDTIAQPSLLAR